MNNSLPDVQGKVDTRGKRINWVGIKGYRIPFTVTRKEDTELQTVGKITMKTSLEESIKGANMSRYGIIIETAIAKKLISTDLIVDMLNACKDILEARDSYIIIEFPYFVKKKAPVSGKESHSAYDCSFCGVLENGEPRLYVEVKVPYTSLCPCSKEMSLNSGSQNAHNQPSLATVRVRFKDSKEFVWIEDLIKVVEGVASCEMWNVLKRQDEKYVTERMYDRPQFVEDMVRDISIELDRYPQIDGYRVEVDHFESIHNHIATSKIKKNL